LRLLARDRALFVGALLFGAAATGLGAPVDFVLFGLMLAGVALFHHHTLQVALAGLAIIVSTSSSSAVSAAAPDSTALRCTWLTSG
jgi:hypothetical protein